MALSRQSLEARSHESESAEILAPQYPVELRKSLGEVSALGDVIAEIDETLASTTGGTETVSQVAPAKEDEVVLVLPEVHYFNKEELPSGGKSWDDDDFMPAVDLNLMDGAIGSNYWHPAV